MSDDKVPKAVIAAPIGVAKETGIQGPEIGGLDVEAPSRREQPFGFEENAARVADMLDEVEHEDHIIALIRDKLLDATTKIAMA